MDLDTARQTPGRRQPTPLVLQSLKGKHHSHSGALQEATMSSGSRPMSGLQKQVLALYRQVLRASKSKPEEMRDEMR